MLCSQRLRGENEKNGVRDGLGRKEGRSGTSSASVEQKICAEKKSRCKELKEMAHQTEVHCASFLSPWWQEML